jgi:hypothetical protein
MLKPFIPLLCFITIGKYYSQEASIVRPIEVNSSEQVIENKTPPTVIENLVTKTYLVKDEDYYSKFINALEVKKDFVLKDSILNQKAIQENWYIKIDNEIKKAEKELKLIKENEK